MRIFLPILLLLVVALSANGKSKERITERGSSLFYRSWRYPIEEEEKKDSVPTVMLPQDSLEKESAVADTLPPLSEPIVDNHATDSDSLSTDGQTTPTEILAGKERDNQDTDIDKCILYFVFDQDNFISNYSAEIDTILNFIDYHKGKNFDIIGHTDERGSIAYNQVLSEKRAEKVLSVLLQKGIERKRLNTIGLSELYPAIPHAKNEKEHQLNRRVEIRVRKE